MDDLDDRLTQALRDAADGKVTPVPGWLLDLALDEPIPQPA